MKPNSTVLVRLKYPVKVGIISFNLPRTIGFSFNQRTLFNVLENNEIDLPDYKQWLEKKGVAVVTFETIFAAAQCYREELRKRDNFTKKGLSIAISQADENTIAEIMKCWKFSEELGYKKPEKSKKKPYRMTSQ